MSRSPRELMRKKERNVLAAQQRITNEEMEQVYAQVAAGVLTSIGSMRTSDDDRIAAAVELLISAGRIEGARWSEWRDFGPMWQYLRIAGATCRPSA